MKKYKNGFTLAEVLITLAIIGVVAAMTIPSLINNTNQEDLRARVKKAYVTLSSVAKQVAMEQGGDMRQMSARDLSNAFAAKLNVVQKCAETTCKNGDDTVSRYNNSSSGYTNSSDAYSLVLADGSLISFRAGDNAVWVNEEETFASCPEPWDPEVKYFRFHVDVTGLGDNRSDLQYNGEFDFVMDKNGVVKPYGSCRLGRAEYAAGAYTVLTNNTSVKLQKGAPSTETWDHDAGSYEAWSLYPYID